MKKISDGALTVATDPTTLPTEAVWIGIDPIKTDVSEPLVISQRDDGVFVSTDAWGTTTLYADQEGSKVLGYETNYGWGNNNYFSEYNANWEIQHSVNTEGNRSTEYTLLDGVLTLTQLTVNYSVMKSEMDGDYTLYYDSDDYGSTITYYKTTATDSLSHYTSAYSNSYVYNDWYTGEAISTSYSGTTTYNAQGNITDSSSNYQSGDYESSDTWKYDYDEHNQLSGVSYVSHWKDASSSTKSTTSYNGAWQCLSTDTTTITNSRDEAGNEQISEQVSNTLYEYGDDGQLLAYTITTTTEKGTDTQRIDVNDMIYYYPPYSKVDDALSDYPLVDVKVGDLPALAGGVAKPEMDGLSSDAIVTSLTDDKGKSHKVYAATDVDSQLLGTEKGDILFGKAGNDVYYVNHKQDKVYETESLTDTSDTGGEDRVDASISYTLGNYVEDLSLTGSDAINGTGNKLDNHLKGNLAKNHLKGGQGDDWLYGGLGSDKLTGNAGEDSFVFDTQLGKKNVDTITDFTAKTDKIVLDAEVFTALSVSGVTDDALLITKSGSKAKTTDQHLIYNSKTGKLYYDEDGSGDASTSVQIAVIGVTKHAMISVDDFMVV